MANFNEVQIDCREIVVQIAVGFNQYVDNIIIHYMMAFL